MPTPCWLKHLLLQQSFGPRVLFSFSLSLRLIFWSTETHLAYSPAQASKTLSRRRTVLSTPSRGHQVSSWATQALCQRTLLVFCVNQGISASLSFSGWSPGVQRLSEFTFLPGLLRPSREGTLRLHPIERVPDASVNRASPVQGLYWLFA